MECPICYENIYTIDTRNTKKKILRCGHIFHKKCINKWFSDHNNCPFCRKQHFNLVVFNKRNKVNDEFKYTGEYPTINLKINNTEYLDVYTQLINQFPVIWDNGESMFPVYSLIDINNKECYVSFYLRQHILFTNKIPKISVGYDKNNKDNEIMFTEDILINKIKAKTYKIMYEWVYDVLHTIKHNYNFQYYTFFNNYICDIITNTISVFNVHANYFQAVICCAIYVLLEKYNIPVDIKYIIYLTTNIYTESDIMKYYDYINYYLTFKINIFTMS